MAQPSQGIDAKFLVIPDKTALPRRCVRTNQPVDEHEYRTWDLPCIPRWVEIIMLLVPFLLIAQPYAARYRCRVKAGVSRGVRRNYLLLKLAAALLVIGSLIAPVTYAALENTGGILISMTAFPFLFWGGLWILTQFTSPLKVMRHDGDVFWIKGCSPAFLESLKGSLADVPKEPIA